MRTLPGTFYTLHVCEVCDLQFPGEPHACMAHEEECRIESRTRTAFTCLARIGVWMAMEGLVQREIGAWLVAGHTDRFAEFVARRMTLGRALDEGCLVLAWPADGGGR